MTNNISLLSKTNTAMMAIIVVYIWQYAGYIMLILSLIHILVDENGDGVLSITKTPFEITMKMQDPETKYFAVMLDANGDIMPYGGVANSNADTYAIQDRDVSTVYIYLCDYYEYMDELKGYYWSDDYEEKAKTKTFKQLLDERAVAGTEVHFDTDK